MGVKWRIYWPREKSDKREREREENAVPRHRTSNPVTAPSRPRTAHPSDRSSSSAAISPPSPPSSAPPTRTCAATRTWSHETQTTRRNSEKRTGSRTKSFSEVGGCLWCCPSVWSERWCWGRGRTRSALALSSPWPPSASSSRSVGKWAELRSGRLTDALTARRSPQESLRRRRTCPRCPHISQGGRRAWGGRGRALLAGNRSLAPRRPSRRHKRAVDSRPRTSWGRSSLRSPLEGPSWRQDRRRAPGGRRRGRCGATGWRIAMASLRSSGSWCRPKVRSGGGWESGDCRERWPRREDARRPALSSLNGGAVGEGEKAVHRRSVTSLARAAGRALIGWERRRRWEVKSPAFERCQGAKWVEESPAQDKGGEGREGEESEKEAEALIVVFLGSNLIKRSKCIVELDL